MVLLIDPYAHRLWSMSEIRVANAVAAVLIRTHEALDIGELARAIRRAYRPGMQAHSLKLHVERDLGLEDRKH
ncbi:MAG: hypothetical protein B7Z80_16725 [Rhodospirillales bacterium 20-64-7]|nr:MAG: hypothetical protein B7Z80_16725 [Rhodospirillales bacterium 20-64-7]